MPDVQRKERMIEVIRYILAFIVFVELAFYADNFAPPESLKNFGIYLLLSLPLLILLVISGGGK